MGLFSVAERYERDLELQSGEPEDKFEIYIHAPESEKERAKAECLEKLRKFSKQAFRM